MPDKVYATGEELIDIQVTSCEWGVLMCAMSAAGMDYIWQDIRRRAVDKQLDESERQWLAKEREKKGAAHE